MNNINFNELTLDNIGQWPALVKYILVAILCVMLIGLGYWFIAKPNFEQYTVLVNEMGTLKQEFEQKQQMAANLDAYRVQLIKMQNRFGHMLKQLPAKHEMPGLLEDISKAGISSGLTFELFAPQPEVEHDFYIELPINIVVEGHYHQLALFLSRVAHMSRIVTLHDFKISRLEDQAKSNGVSTSKPKDTHELLVMEITAKIYRYRTL